MHSSRTSEDGNYLYSAREIGGSAANGPSPGDVRVYDVSNPASPLLVNRVTMNDLGLNAVTPHNPVVRGNKLYVSWYQAGLQLFDISQPATLNRIGQYDTYQAAFSETEFLESLSPGTEPWDIVCGKANLQNVVPTGYEGLWAVYPFLGEDRILIGDLKEGLMIVDVTRATEPNKNSVSDFDGDGKTDIASYQPSSGVWQVERSSDGQVYGLGFGSSGDIPISGDFDGDRKIDHGVFRPNGGQWWIFGSSAGVMMNQWGMSSDIPVPADYDADGKTDLAVWRPSDGVWYILQSTLGFKYHQWGMAGDKPVAGDFDGDGKSDAAVWRPSTGVWWVIPSTSSIPVAVQWGMAGDKPVFGDFTGDGRSDFAVYRPNGGTWYVMNADLSAYNFYQFGLESDIPVPADYDGDGKTDIAVYRPADRTWWKLSSLDQSVTTKQFGGAGDFPTAASVNPQ